MYICVHTRFILLFKIYWGIYFILFKYKFIYSNWRPITSQYCIGSAIHQHESTTGIHVFPTLNPLPLPSPYHPSGLSQCTSPKHPVSYIKPGLAIHFIYDIIHVSRPFSQIIPPYGNPLQCSCLENPRDGGAWWAAIYGVAQSWTRLKRLSSSSSSIPLPQSPKDCSIHLCLLCCLAYRVVVTIFLNSIYMC